MLLSLVLSLTTSQVQVIAVITVPDTVIRQSPLCRRRKCVDGTAIHQYLFADGMLVGQDFQGFQAAPMKGWPEALVPQWKDGVKACREVAGPPPWKDGVAMSTASSCAKRLSERLWGAWLTHQKAERVAVFSAVYDDTSVTLTVLASEFPSTSRVWIEEKAPLDKADAALGRLAAAAESLSGQREPWVSPPPPDQTGAPVFASKKVVSTAVAGVKSCDAAPASLRFAAPGAVGESVAARWSASVKGKAPARECTVAESSHQEDMMGAMLSVATVKVTCGDTMAVAESAADAPNAIEVTSANVVKKLAAQWCP